MRVGSKNALGTTEIYLTKSLKEDYIEVSIGQSSTVGLRKTFVGSIEGKTKEEISKFQESIDKAVEKHQKTLEHLSESFIQREKPEPKKGGFKFPDVSAKVAKTIIFFLVGGSLFQAVNGEAFHAWVDEGYQEALISEQQRESKQHLARSVYLMSRVSP